MKKFIAILVFASGLTLQLHAQTFLDDLQKSKSGEGKVTVKQSADIDNLVNNAKLNAGATTSTAAQPQKKEEPVAQTEKHNNAAESANKDNERKQQQQSAERHHATTRDNDGDSTEENRPIDTSKKVMRNSRKVTGYRIQAYSGGNTKADRTKANQIGDAIKMKYPDQPVYVHFYSPRWICRVGNFRSYNEAAQLLKGIKAMGYTQACIVKGKISVAY